MLREHPTEDWETLLSINNLEKVQSRLSRQQTG